MLRKFSLLTVFAVVAFAASAQVDVVEPDLSIRSKVAPKYFGPNALPVLDVHSGRTSDRVLFDIGFDYFDGHYGDVTYDCFVKLVVPIFSDRVNMSLWFQSLGEWYEMSEESREHCRLPEDVAMSGIFGGDAYITTDIQLLEQDIYTPDVLLRVGLKTALGHGFYAARNFDAPGYFFDLTLAKSYALGGSFFEELRLMGSLGFLCWQTDNGRQNDAVTYGGKINLKTKYFTLSESLGGYTGWERDGDAPFSIKSELRTHFGKYEPFIAHQYGFRDYPFTQYRVGVTYKF